MTDVPRMGDNIDAPYGESVTDRLAQDYNELLARAKNLIADAEDLPLVVESHLDVAVIADVIVKMRDVTARGEHHRVAEKEPFLRGGEAVQAFFMKRVIEPLDLERRNLQGRLDHYKQRQLAEERAKREAEAAAARRAQQEAQKAREDAEAAARRARSVESMKQRDEEAARAKVEDAMASAKAEEATLATMARAGRMVGERFEGSDRSGKVTMRKKAVVYITDVYALDLELLRPFLKEEYLLTALRAWAKETNYDQEMPGAVVRLTDTTVVT